MSMEKRNVYENGRTPCRCKEGDGSCDCPACSKKVVKSSSQNRTLQPESIHDIDRLARVHGER